jgi:hypothetical protein
MEPGGWHTTSSFLCNVIANNFCFSKVGRNGGLRQVERFIENTQKLSNLREVGWWGGGMDWIDLAQDRDRWLTSVKAVMNFRVS